MGLNSAEQSPTPLVFRTVLEACNLTRLLSNLVLVMHTKRIARIYRSWHLSTTLAETFSWWNFQTVILPILDTVDEQKHWRGKDGGA